MKRLGRSFASCNLGIRTSMCSTVSGWRLDRGGAARPLFSFPFKSTNHNTCVEANISILTILYPRSASH
jgi:hypothetical protein